MSTSTTLSSVLSALGGSDGIDVTSAVDDILYADRAPERAWAAQQTTLASQTSAITQLESEASSLSDALSALQSSTGVLSTATVDSSDSDIVTATAANGTAAGTHTVLVKSLATTGSWYSDAEASSSTTLSSGSFDLTVGGTTTTIDVGETDGVDSGVDTLDELATAINQQSLGVTASVVTDSSGARLSLVSATSGSAGDLSISNDSSINFTRANTGADASLTVDGVPVSSASNTVTGALSGVTLNLASASAGTTVTLDVGSDTDSIGTALESFVSAYNTLIEDVNSQFTYNSTTDTAGTLQGDSVVQGLQTERLDATNYNTGGSSLSTLTALGITTNSDGTLSIDSTTLENAITTNSAAVASFFQGTNGNGFAASLNTTLDTYTDSTDGAFTVDLSSIASENTELTDETDTLELYLSSQETVLTASYNQADIEIQQLPQEIKNTDALLNPNSGSSSS